MLETLQNNASVENFSPREKTWRTRDRHSWKSLRADYYRDGHSTSRFPLQAINDPNSIRFGSNLFGYVKWIIGDLMDFHRKKKEEEEREKTPEKREKERKKNWAKEAQRRKRTVHHHHLSIKQQQQQEHAFAAQYLYRRWRTHAPFLLPSLSLFSLSLEE